MFRKKNKPEPPSSPEELWDALMQAIQQNEGERFATLCQDHRAEILEAFPVWQKPDPATLGDADRVQAHINLLGQLAQYFAKVLGHPELWEALTGGKNNPFARWDAARTEIGKRVEALDFAGAIERSRELLADVTQSRGDGAEQTAEQVRGQLGQLLFHSGRVDEAIPELESTLERCQKRGDPEAVGIYLNVLHDADRYAGRASRWREALAAHLESIGDADQATWVRSVGQRYPEGEPLVRMVMLAPDGRRAELDEPMPGKSVQVIFERSRPSLALAERWLARGRKHAESNDFEGAIASYTAAVDADPYDPHPRYQQAYLLMRADRPADALKHYEEVERLAPGWFHSRTWRSIAQRQLVGAVPHALVRLIDLLEDGGLGAEERLEMTREPILKLPRVPELYLYRGNALSELGRDDDAQSAWLAGLEVSEELPAIRSRVLIALGRLNEVLEIEKPNLMALAAATIQMRARN